MSDFKRDTIDSATKWTSLEKDVAAVHSDSIKFFSTGLLEFGKITVQSLIVINAGALTIAPAIVKIVSDTQNVDFKYFSVALGAFVFGLILALICSYASYVQYNFDLGEQIGVKERTIEFFKSTKEIEEGVNFVSFDNKRYSELVEYVDKCRRSSSRIVWLVQLAGWGSAVLFIIGSFFSAAHVMKIDLSRFICF